MVIAKENLKLSHGYLGSRVVRPLLQLSERWPCHIWLVEEVKFASHEANVGWGLLFYLVFLFSLPLSGRCPDMTEPLLTGTLGINPISKT